MTEVIDKDYDTVFFCPPYYDLELYGGSDLQSTILYQTIQPNARKKVACKPLIYKGL